MYTNSKANAATPYAGTTDTVQYANNAAKTKACMMKLKYFSQHIDGRNFDLMQLQRGIWRSAQKHGITEKHTKLHGKISEKNVTKI